MKSRDRRSTRRKQTSTTRRAQSTASTQSGPKYENPLESEKSIELNLNCYLLVVDTEQLMQCTTLEISKSGMLLKSMYPLALSQEVVCLLSNKKNLNRHMVKAAKEAMKGRVIRVEKQPFLFKVTVQITMGRVNPLDAFGLNGDVRSWWSRHWQ